MDSSKCYSCGLVNWQGAAACSRCGSVIELAQRSAQAGRNPYEGQEPKKGFPVLRVLIVLMVVSAIGFGAYKATLPEPPKEKPLAEQQARAVQQLQAQGQAVLQQQVVREQKSVDDWEKNAKAIQDVKWQKLPDPKCKMTGSMANPSTGGYSPVMECK